MITFMLDSFLVNAGFERGIAGQGNAPKLGLAFLSLHGLWESGREARHHCHRNAGYSTTSGGGLQVVFFPAGRQGALGQGLSL
jgi:hypothetical protein